VVTSLIAFIAGAADWPTEIISAPPSLEPLFLKLDITGVFSLNFLPILLVVFILDFVDTMGTLIGVSARANLLDDNHNLPEIEKPLLADAIATVTGALAGTSTSGKERFRIFGNRYYVFIMSVLCPPVCGYTGVRLWPGFDHCRLSHVVLIKGFPFR
jgi:hypothetical protein